MSTAADSPQVVVATADRVVGEAIAAALSRCGYDAYAVVPQDVVAPVDGALVLYAWSTSPLDGSEVMGWVGENTTRVILLGSAEDVAPPAVDLHAKVDAMASMDALLHAVRGSGASASPGTRPMVARRSHSMPASDRPAALGTSSEGSRLDGNSSDRHASEAIAAGLYGGAGYRTSPGIAFDRGLTAARTCEELM